MLTGIDHVVFYCDDLRATIAWYSERFGLGVERLDAWERGESSFVSLRVSEAIIIDLLERESYSGADAASSDGGAEREANERAATGNVDHVAFVTDGASFDAYAASHRSEIEMGPTELSGAQGVGRGFYTRDPSGNRIELRTYD